MLPFRILLPIFQCPMPKRPWCINQDSIKDTVMSFQKPSCYTYYDDTNLSKVNGFTQKVLEILTACIPHWHSIIRWMFTDKIYRNRISHKCSLKELYRFMIESLCLSLSCDCTDHCTNRQYGTENRILNTYSEINTSDLKLKP